MEHYYSSEPKASHDINTIQYRYGEHTLEFTTDAGVFSKSRVDFGTSLMINSYLSYKENTDLGCGYGPIGISVAF